MRVVGLDIGTTGCKAVVYEPSGACLWRGYRDYPVTRSASAHEVDPASIAQAAFDTLAEAASRYPGIGAVGVSSFGETFVLLDEKDAPLHPAILYTDPRGQGESESLAGALGQGKISHITGLSPHPMYSLPKLLWLQNNRPEVFAKARRCMQMAEYIVYLLTGQARVDYSLATRTLAFDIRALAWSGEILEASGISPALFSKPVPIGAGAGTVKPDIAAKLGLPPETLVVSCGQDQIAAAVGGGVFDPDTAVDGAGTVECITPVFHGIPDQAVMARGGYSIVPYVTPGDYVCYAFSYTGGALLKWYADTFEAKDGGNVYEELEGSGLREEPTGLLVLPHFAGAATPYMDPGSKGVIMGLTLSTTKQEIYHALMEGVCYEMRLNMERLREAGIRFRSLRATGGGANSRLWTQMKADILNVPVTALKTSEAGTAGCAMMAGVAAGLYPSLKEAASLFVQEKETFHPREDVHRRYREAYERYKGLYGAVRPLLSKEK